MEVIRSGREDIEKEMGCGNNRKLNVIYCVITAVIVWNMADFIGVQ
jgi:hypothetical protein